MKKALLAWVIAPLLVSPVAAHDRFGPGRWEQGPGYRYDYDPRSPYPQHRIDPAPIRGAPGFPRHFSRDRYDGSRLQRWHERRDRDHWDRRLSPRHDWRDYDRSPRGFYYGPYPAYPSYPSYRFYRQ